MNVYGMEGLALRGDPLPVMVLSCEYRFLQHNTKCIYLHTIMLCKVSFTDRGTFLLVLTCIHFKHKASVITLSFLSDTDIYCKPCHVFFNYMLDIRV